MKIRDALGSAPDSLAVILDAQVVDAAVFAAGDDDVLRLCVDAVSTNSATAFSGLFCESARMVMAFQWSPMRRRPEAFASVLFGSFMCGYGVVVSQGHDHARCPAYPPPDPKTTPVNGCCPGRSHPPREQGAVGKEGVFGPLARTVANDRWVGHSRGRFYERAPEVSRVRNPQFDQCMKTVRDVCELQPNALSIKLSDQIEQLDELIHAEGEGEAFFEKKRTSPRACMT